MYGSHFIYWIAFGYLNYNMVLTGPQQKQCQLSVSSTCVPFIMNIQAPCLIWKGKHPRHRGESDKLDRQCRKCYDGLIVILTNTHSPRRQEGSVDKCPGQNTFLSNIGRNVRNRVRRGRKNSTSILFLLRLLIPLALNTQLKVFTCLAHRDSVPTINGSSEGLIPISVEMAF